MSFSFRFDPIEVPPEAKELRQEVRAFLCEEIEAGTFSPDGGKGSFSREFSRKVGAKGWIGLTWPVEYGGLGRPAAERLILFEELTYRDAPLLNAIGWGLAGQRAQNLDERRASRRFHDRAASYLALDQRKSAAWADAVSGRHEDAGDHNPADHQPDRVARFQRGRVRRCVSAGFASHRRG